MGYNLLPTKVINHPTTSLIQLKRIFGGYYLNFTAIFALFAEKISFTLLSCIFFAAEN